MNCSFSEIPACRAAAVVITLKVDPGGYRSEMARLVNGEDGSSRSRCQDFPCSSVSWVASRFGSYDGADTIARTRPVDGSNATTDPLHGPPQPSWMARHAAC